MHLEEKNSLETSHGLVHTHTHMCISRGNDRRVEDIDDATTRCQGIPAIGDAITVKSKISRYVVKIQISVARKGESGSVAPLLGT